MKYLFTSALCAFALAACGADEPTPPAETAAVEAEPAAAEPAPAPVEVSEAPSTNLIIIYSLKDGVSPGDFEAWVTSTDYPSMRGLSRVEAFTTHRAEGLMPGTGEGEPSVDYIETFSIPDLEGFMSEDMGGETVQSVMGAFMGFAEAPQFILVTEVE